MEAIVTLVPPSSFVSSVGVSVVRHKHGRERETRGTKSCYNIVLLLNKTDEKGRIWMHTSFGSYMSEII